MTSDVEFDDDDAIDAGTGVYSAKHRKLLEFRGLPGRLSILAALGDYGAGKTYLGAELAFDAVTEWSTAELASMGFTAQDPPIGLMVAPNFDGLMQGPVAAFMRICPPELIERAVLYPLDPRIELINGWRINLYTTQKMDPIRGGRGPTACWVWADEIQDKTYAIPGLWRNIRSRVRDKRSPRPFVLATGIPFRGTHVEELFRTRPHPQRCTTILSTEDNRHNLHPDAAATMELDTSATMAQKDGEGWIMRTSQAIWGHFSEANIISVDLATIERKTAVTHLGVDLRKHAAVVMGQEISVTVRLAGGGERKEKALLIVDQVMADHRSAQRIAEHIRDADRWAIGSGSEMWFDPTISDDEINQFTSALKGARWRKHAGAYKTERAGVECVDVRICDKFGNRRLLIASQLVKDTSRRGVVQSLRGYDGSKDSEYAHAADAIRYLVCGRLPLGRDQLPSLDPGQNPAKAFGR